MLRVRWMATLALIPLALAACSSGAASTPATTAADQPAQPTVTAPATPSVPQSMQPEPETSASASPSISATVDPDAKVIYLTFDDGPWVPYTQQMLDVLDKYDAKATFFVVGEMAKQHMGLVKKEYEAGHAIGNHTWGHANLTTVSDDEVREEIGSVDRLLGQYLSPCLRPPYGATNDRVRAITKELGFRTVLWTDWAVDWEQPPVPTLMNYLKDATKDRANILLHDGGGDRPNTVEAVRQMIPKWIKQGYTFAPVPACLKPAP